MFEMDKGKERCKEQATYNPDSKAIQFTKSMHHSVDSTSTPLLSRTRSNTDEHLLTQDSGFSEVSSLLCCQSSQPDCGSPDLEPYSSTLNCKAQQPEVVTPDTQRDKDDAGLQRMQVYYDKLNQSTPARRRIGRRVGEEFVDVLSELCACQIPALSKIYALLGDQDLLSCMKVSKSWRAALRQDKIARIRLAKDRIQRLMGKENGISKEEDASRSQVSSSNAPLTSIQVINNTSPHSSCTSSPEDWVPEKDAMFRRFAKAAQTLKTGEQFVKCSRCSGPSKLHPEARRATCTSESCKYDCCTLCELEFHGDADCPTRSDKKTKTKDRPISSKASKKHLKRL